MPRIQSSGGLWGRLKKSRHLSSVFSCRTIIARSLKPSTTDSGAMALSTRKKAGFVARLGEGRVAMGWPGRSKGMAQAIDHASHPNRAGFHASSGKDQNRLIIAAKLPPKSSRGQPLPPGRAPCPAPIGAALSSASVAPRI